MRGAEPVAASLVGKGDRALPSPEDGTFSLTTGRRATGCAVLERG